MAFTTTSGQTGDVLSGLVALLSDPKASAAKLVEIKEAMAALDLKAAHVNKLHEESVTSMAKSRAAEGALAKKQAEFAAAEKALEEKINLIDKKMADLAVSADVANKAKQGLQDQEGVLKRQTAESDRIAKMNLAEINNKTLVLNNKLAELEKKSAEVDKKEKRLDVQIELYDSKLAKLKSII